MSNYTCFECDNDLVYVPTKGHLPVSEITLDKVREYALALANQQRPEVAVIGEDLLELLEEN